MSGEQTGVGLLFRYRRDPSLARRVMAAGPTAGSGDSPSRRPPGRHRCRQLRHVHASAAPPWARRRPPRRGGDLHLSVGCQRAEDLRVRQVLDGLPQPARGRQIDAVLIATRHHAHARMAADALRAGKAVFVEKPLAISREDLDVVLDAIDETGNDRLMVGFNRRFAPLLTSALASWGRRTGPITVRYDVNAGALSPGSWYARPEEGSRIVGECGHFIDTASWWIGSDHNNADAALQHDLVAGDALDQVIQQRRGLQEALDVGEDRVALIT